VNWIRSGYSNCLMYYIIFWSLKNSSLNCNFRKKSQTLCCAHTHYGIICKISQRFSLKFQETCHEKIPGVFYGQVLTNFNFSEFWIIDFRHKKFLKFCNVNSHKNFCEFIVTKICKSKSRKTKISQNLSIKYSWIFFMACFLWNFRENRWCIFYITP
jgi:hypothetical protein